MFEQGYGWGSDPTTVRARRTIGSLYFNSSREITRMDTDEMEHFENSEHPELFLPLDYLRGLNL